MTADIEGIRGWLTGRLPEDWFAEAPTVVVDREEITIVGRLDEPRVGEEASTAERTQALAGRISAWREASRQERMVIASELQRRTGRRVAWGAICGERQELFTSLSVPVMTRLRQPERRVLDTLVESGVARSRSDALAWCVRLVDRHSQEWLGELRSALGEVRRLRDDAPQ